MNTVAIEIAIAGSVLGDDTVRESVLDEARCEAKSTSVLDLKQATV